jgi:hypothetical protein
MLAVYIVYARIRAAVAQKPLKKKSRTKTVGYLNEAGQLLDGSSINKWLTVIIIPAQCV